MPLWWYGGNRQTVGIAREGEPLSSSRSEQKSAVKNNIGKAFIGIVALTIQVVCIYLVAQWLSAWSTVITALVDVAADLLVLFLYGQRANAAYKMPWIILILAFPLLGVVLYLLLGSHLTTSGVRRQFAAMERKYAGSLVQDEEAFKALEEQMRLEEEARQEEEARRLAEQEAMDAEQRALWEKQQQEEEARLEALRMEMRRQALIEQGYDPDNLLNTPFAELPPEEETPAENPLDFLPSHEEERPVEEASAPEEKKEKVEKRAKGTLKKKNKRKGIVVPGSGDDGTTPLPKGKNAPRKIEKARPKKSRQVVRKVYKDHEGNTYSEAEVQARRHKGEAE